MRRVVGQEVVVVVVVAVAVAVGKDCSMQVEAT